MVMPLEVDAMLALTGAPLQSDAEPGAGPFRAGQTQTKPWRGVS
jgi:hypothetical protein